MKDTNKQSSFWGIVFLIWFFMSIMGMIYFAELQNTIVAVALFGQCFLVFGLVITFISKEKVGIIPMLVGGTVLIGVGINMFSTEEVKTLFNDRGIPILVGAAFFLVGLGMLIIPRYTENQKKNRCTYPVEAKCIRIIKDNHDRRTLYAPVFEFYAGGEVHTYNSDLYSNVVIPNIGDCEILYVNPENYSEVYRPTPSVHKKLIGFMGIIFTICGALVMYFMITDLIKYIAK